jgi:hypothetical protein
VRDSRNVVNAQELREPLPAEVPVVVPSSSGAVSGPDFPPDLARVVAAWPDLPAAIKAGVLALVDARAGDQRGLHNGKTGGWFLRSR